MSASIPRPGCIVTLGETLVEIMAEQRGEGFRAPLHLQGPYPSGAPAIFIDQVAKLGQAAGLISCVGDDDFGWLNIERLKRDGVDVSAIRVLPDQATGSAFVRYREDGERDFVFNVKNSACGQTRIADEGSALLARCAHFHIMGSSLFSFRLIDEAKKAIEQVKAAGGTISFDPNVRKEMLNIPEMRAALQMMLHYCDIFMPSGPELMRSWISASRRSSSNAAPPAPATTAARRQSMSPPATSRKSIRPARGIASGPPS